jgi:hypothetical protein
MPSSWLAVRFRRCKSKLLEQSRHLPPFGCRECRAQPVHCLRVGGKRALNFGPARRRQVHDPRPRILVAATPLEQLPRLQPIDGRRDGPASQPHGSAQVIDR